MRLIMKILLIFSTSYCRPRFKLKTTSTLKIPKTTAPTKIITGKRKCSIPGALAEGESTRIKYQALAEKDITTGLAIEAMAAVLVFAFFSNKPPIPELINIGIRLMAKIMAVDFISTSIAILN